MEAAEAGDTEEQEPGFANLALDQPESGQPLPCAHSATAHTSGRGCGVDLGASRGQGVGGEAA